MSALTVRHMRDEDAEQCVQIQKRVYHDELWEEADRYLYRLNGYRPGCFVAAEGDVVHGYLQSHPWSGDDVPSVVLEQPADGSEPRPASIPHTGDFYFLFDCAVSPDAQGRGVAVALAQAAMAHARALGMTLIKLVAVSGADAYWARYGFEALELLPAGSGYGTQRAVLMHRSLLMPLPPAVLDKVPQALTATAETVGAAGVPATAPAAAPAADAAAAVAAPLASA